MFANSTCIDGFLRDQNWQPIRRNLRLLEYAGISVCKAFVERPKVTVLSTTNVDIGSTSGVDKLGGQRMLHLALRKVSVTSPASS